MSGARVFDVENRLAKVLCGIGGETQAKLVEDAAERVRALEATIRDYVQEQVGHIIAFAGKSEEELFSESGQLGRHATNVTDVAAAVGLKAIGEVAGGINSLIENLAASGLWHTDALRLHLNAMTLLQQGGIGREGEDVILGRLRVMRHAIGAQE